MKMQLWPSEPGCRVSRAYDRQARAKKETPAERRERVEAVRHAHSIHRANAQAMPRLVAPAPLQTFTMADFLASSTR